MTRHPLRSFLLIAFVVGCAGRQNPEPSPTAPPVAPNDKKPAATATPHSDETERPKAFLPAGGCRIAKQGFCIESERVAPSCELSGGEAVKTCTSRGAIGSCSRTRGTKAFPIRDVTYYYPGTTLGPADQSEARAMCEKNPAAPPGEFTPLP